MIEDTEKFIKAFKSKVIMYLYEDAVKQRKHNFFDGCDSSKYSSVCDAFDKKEWESLEIHLRNYIMTSKGMMHNGDCFKICQGTAAVYKE